jgi:hypothetical protein
MIRLRELVTAAALAMVVAGPSFAQDYRGHALRYGNTSSWYFDGRDDGRDLRTNGLFPGNFATDPAYAAIGAAGIIGSNPWHSAMPYPSQVFFGLASPQACRDRHHRCNHSAGKGRTP